MKKSLSIYKRWFWPFVAPAALLFLMVIVIPFVVGIFDSFVVWRGTYYFNPVTRTRAANPFEAFVGLLNYKNALTDQRFIASLWYTVRYTIVNVIVVNVISLLLAILITKITNVLAGIFRTIFFLPNMLGGLAMGFIFQFVFQIVFTDMLFGPDGIAHIEALRYMTQDSAKAIFALSILGTWQSAGYMMLIYVAGLNAIPVDFYEAANIDGASAWLTFWKITVPMLMPSFTIVFFMTLSGSFKVLDTNVALTNGDFGTRMLAFQILQTVRDTNPPDYGKGQAQAVIFFIIVAIMSLTQVYITKRKELEA